MGLLYRLTRVLPLLAILLAGTAFGADGSAIMYPRAMPRSGTAAESAKSGIATPLLIAAGLAVAGGWLIWRTRRSPAMKRGTALTIHETRSLGGRQYLVVAAFENQRFLLGVCPGTISLLSKLDADGKKEAGL